MKILPPKGMSPALAEWWTPEQRVYASRNFPDIQWMFPARKCCTGSNVALDIVSSVHETTCIKDGDRLLPNLTQESPMPEKIVMAFHPIESKPETVKGRRLSEFMAGDQVVSYLGSGSCAVRTIVRHSGENVTMDNRTFEVYGPSSHSQWYLESDIINGRPREIPAEPVRKTVGELKAGEVFEWNGGKWIVGNQGPGCCTLKTCVQYGGIVITGFGHDLVVTLLGHVTFGETA